VAACLLVRIHLTNLHHQCIDFTLCLHVCCSKREDPALLFQKFAGAKALYNPSRAYLVCFRVSAGEWTIAERLDIFRRQAHALFVVETTCVHNPQPTHALLLLMALCCT
jgi:hypothetical protein